MSQKVFLTGATGTMGSLGLKEILKDPDNTVIALVLPREKDLKLVKEYLNNPRVEVRWGDLTNYKDVEACVKGVDMVLHVGAFVSPEADYYPEKAMKINYGSTRNIINAIKEHPNRDSIKLVYIGTVAETGDRMPPIHWGRVGDPIKPSVHDYYAVSKIAAERAVIESGLKQWVSLRQTGILSPKMVATEDGIMFHNCLDNVLEWVSDRDSGILLGNICKPLPESFWGHIYNIGGGESCRISCYEMMKGMFGPIGIKNLGDVLEANWFATRNFHGQFYLDSDKLNDYLHFRNDGFDYCYQLFLAHLGSTVAVTRTLTKLPGGQKFLGSAMKKRFQKLALTERGTMNFIENKRTDFIDPFFISESEWRKISKFSELSHFDDWNQVIPIDHGYDESKPESELTVDDMKGAAKFRGGKCLSDSIINGDMTSKLTWKCAFGHEFQASPRLVFEGGHWCPQCERESWNYHEIAKVNPFFAQVWYPLHDKNEPSKVYKKIVTELDV